MVWFAESLAGYRQADRWGDIGRAMQLGFNTNFRHRDVVFHVQTEDSGRANPHVITHLFHGGNIIASVKSDYSGLLAEGDLESAVRKMMESQHKAMLKQLSRGEFDRAIRERLGAAVFGESTASDSPGSKSDATPAGAPPAAPARSTPSSPAPSASASSAPPGRSSTDRTPGVTPRSAAERTSVGADRRDTSSGLAKVFGERVVSEKPLDEVVLDYLVQNARKRKRPPQS